MADHSEHSPAEAPAPERKWDIAGGGGEQNAYRSTFENAAVGISHVAPDGRWLRVNPHLCQIVGYTEAELLESSFQAITHPEDLESDLVEFERLKRSEIDSYQMEKRYFHKDGHIVWVSLAVAPIRDEAGRLRYCVSTVQDISARKRAEEALRISENRARWQLAELQATYNTAPVGLGVLDRELRFVRLNRRLAEINGLSIADHLGQPMQDILPGLAERAVPLLQRILEEGRPMLNLELSGETPAQPRVLRTWVENWYPIKAQAGRVIGINMVVEEITSRKAAEAERERLLQELEAERAHLKELTDHLEETVRQRTGQVRQLAGELTLVEQQERRRIAQILHDDIQQMLVALKVSMHLSREGAPAPQQAALVEMAQQVDEIVEATRALSMELSSPARRSESLAEIFRWLAYHTEQQYGLKVALQIEGQPRMPDEERRELVVRLVRELLTNIVKHAGVQEAQLILRQQDDNLLVDVVDQGRGFNVEEVMRSHSQMSFGLYSVRERLSLFGGDLQLEAAPGQGTHARLLIPRAGTAG